MYITMVCAMKTDLGAIFFIFCLYVPRAIEMAVQNCVERKNSLNILE